MYSRIRISVCVILGDTVQEIGVFCILANKNFMQEITNAHRADNSMVQIHREFHDGKVGRNLWRPRSPDMNPCEFYQWELSTMV